MNEPHFDCEWLVGHRFKKLTRREYDWVLNLGEDDVITIGCLWRFLDPNRVVLTSQDDGHQFGLPVPVDAEQEVSRCLKRAKVTDVFLTPASLDLELMFSSGHRFQILPNSAGYESWDLYYADLHLMAQGSRLHKIDEPT